jgi:anaerobic ribonucleoside-triphosphate reductase activating protein
MHSGSLGIGISGLPGVSADRRLNVAATCVATDVLGPGRRGVVWVQGCPFACPGCVAPEWIPDRTATLVEVDELVTELLSDPAVIGLTFSGGEPMMQADGLARLAAAARRQRELSVICFTGFTIRQLATPSARALLAQVDVLIDGRYVRSRDNGRGLRGSTNQRVHWLTARISPADYDFEDRARTVEVRLSGRELLLVGVPPRGLLDVLDIGGGLSA